MFSNEFNELENMLYERKNTTAYNICSTCDMPMTLKEQILICFSCGIERPCDVEPDEWVYSITQDQNYNVSNDSFMPFKAIGHGSYYYQKSLLKSCSDYDIYRCNNNKRELENKIYQYKGIQIPKNIINKTSKMFNIIKQHNYVFRRNGKWGVIAACLYYMCLEEGVPRTRQEISKILNIEEKFLSQGENTLAELAELNIIYINKNKHIVEDYIKQYFNMLNIPDIFIPFIIELIKVSDERRVIINESRISTKCTGAIYLLCNRIPNLSHITKEIISEKCFNISKTTFIKYYNTLMKNPDKIKFVFKKHRIPMPVEWRIDY